MTPWWILAAAAATSPVCELVDPYTDEMLTDPTIERYYAVCGLPVPPPAGTEGGADAWAAVLVPRDPPVPCIELPNPEARLELQWRRDALVLEETLGRNADPSGGITPVDAIDRAIDELARLGACAPTFAEAFHSARIPVRERPAEARWEPPDPFPWDVHRRPTWVRWRVPVQVMGVGVAVAGTAAASWSLWRASALQPGLGLARGQREAQTYAAWSDRQQTWVDVGIASSTAGLTGLVTTLAVTLAHPRHRSPHPRLEQAEIASDQAMLALPTEEP